MPTLTPEELPPPAPPGLVYRPFQIEAIVEARTRPNLLIADEMGVGKTVEAIGVINDNRDIRKVLVICSASLRINWFRELSIWIVRRNTTLGIASTRNWPLADIVIANYEVLKPLHRNIHTTAWDLVIVDEAHALKNGNTNRTLEVLGREHRDKMKQRPRLVAKRWLFLSGTPIVNRPFELWPLLHHLAPEDFPVRQDFINQFCGGRKGGQKSSDIGPENLKLLHDKLRSTVMIRRLKRDVLPELPAKIRQVIVLPQDRIRGAVAQERSSYDELQQRLALARIKAELAKASYDDELYAQTVRALQQIEFITIQEITKLRFKTALSKVPLVIDHVHLLLQHVRKVVVFAWHVSVVENIALGFGNAVAIVHGKVSQQERQKRIDRFQHDPECRVFVGTIKASGEGHTLTAGQVALFAELDWTPSSLEQASDRLHRMGQPSSVHVQHLVLNGSIDAMLANRVVEKQETISSALDAQTTLYALAHAVPFTPQDRGEIHKLASTLSELDIENIHSAISILVAGGIRGNMTALDYELLRIIAGMEALEPPLAALGYTIFQKYQK
jgi:SNF2 family DNA or RNA helicase